MSGAGFPRAYRAEGKRRKAPVVRVQYDARHLGGEGLEVCGIGDAWMVEVIDALVSEWRQDKPTMDGFVARLHNPGDEPVN